MKHALLTLSLLTALLSGCAAAPHAGEPLASTAAEGTAIDLDRYLGRWYVIASIPTSAERGRVGSYVELSRRADGGIDEAYWSRELTFIPELEKKEATAKVLASSGNAHWKISRGWGAALDQVILYVDPEYRYAVLGHPSRDYAWIYAREIYIGDETYQQLLEVLSQQGYDVSHLLKVPQRPEYLGLPGYQ